MLELLMQALSWVGDYRRFPWYLATLGVAAVAYAATGEPLLARRVAIPAFRFLLSFAVAAPLAGALKQALSMPRPDALLQPGASLPAASDALRSMPSGHAVFAAVFVTSLWPGLPRWGRVLAVLFLLGVCTSRVWLGAHHPIDVVVGAALGATVGWTVQGLCALWLKGKRVTASAFGVALAVAASDLGSKLLVVEQMHVGESWMVAPIFNVVLWLNKGAAFSVLADGHDWQRILLLIVAVVVSGWIMFQMMRTSTPAFDKLALGAILGGAAGNIFDRTFRGAVIDWLDFHWAQHHWPAFNLADTGICMGVAALLILDYRRLRSR